MSSTNGENGVSRVTADYPQPQQTPSLPLFHRLLVLIRRRKSLLLLVVAGALILGSLHYAQRTPIYQSNAQVLVTKKNPDVLPVTGINPAGAFYDDFLATHLAVIRSPGFLAKHVITDEVRGLGMFKNGLDPTFAIIAGLQVQRETPAPRSSSGIIFMSFKGEVASDCSVVLQAVIDGYRKFLDENYSDTTKQATDLIKEATSLLFGKLNEKNKEYQEFRKNAKTLWRGKDNATVRMTAYDSLSEQRMRVRLQKAELEARLKHLQEASAAGNRSELLDAMLRPVAKQQEGDAQGARFSLQSELARLEVEEKRLLQEYGEENPRVVAVRSHAKILRDYLTGGKKDKDLLAVYLDGLKNDLRHLEIQDEVLSVSIATEEKELRDQVNEELKERDLRTEITRQEQLYEQVFKKMNEVSLAKELGGGFKIEELFPPSPADKIEPNAPQTYALALFFGLIAGVGLLYLADYFDRSFRSPEEIRTSLNLPILGHIPLISEEEEEIGESIYDPKLFAYHKPKSPLAEGYRSVRTSLYFSTHGEKHKVIQVTSPSMSDGKTTLSTNLAVTIAQSGRRVVIVDADFRRPRVHKVFGLEPEKGFVTAIQKGHVGEEIGDYAMPSGIPMLSVLPCGPIPSNPSELISSDEFEKALNSLRQLYDFVIVDTPPVLVVTDPCAVAPRVDGVLLTVRVSKNGRPAAVRTREILSGLMKGEGKDRQHVNILGVVVNGAGASRDYYYHGGYYRYGYGGYYNYYSNYYYSNYNYRYGYNYGYYHDDEDRGGQRGSSKKEQKEQSS